jgi:hypothetical protein
MAADDMEKLGNLHWVDLECERHGLLMSMHDMVEGEVNKEEERTETPPALNLVGPMWRTRPNQGGLRAQPQLKKK